MIQLYHDYISPHCDLDLEGSISILWHDTPARDESAPYQVWIHTVELFRGYLLDKAGRQTLEQTDTRTRRFQYITHPLSQHFYM